MAGSLARDARPYGNLCRNSLIERSDDRSGHVVASARRAPFSITERSLRTNPDRNQRLMPHIRPGSGCPYESCARWFRFCSIEGRSHSILAIVPACATGRNSRCYSAYSTRSVTVSIYPSASGGWLLILATFIECHRVTFLNIGRMTYSANYAFPTQYDVRPSCGRGPGANAYSSHRLVPRSALSALSNLAGISCTR